MSTCEGQQVHAGIRGVFGGYIPFYPRVENTGAVDAEQNAQTGLSLLVVDVGKGVDARQRVVVDRAVDTVYHARCSGSRGNLSGIEYVE